MPTCSYRMGTKMMGAAVAVVGMVSAPTNLCHYSDFGLDKNVHRDVSLTQRCWLQTFDKEQE